MKNPHQEAAFGNLSEIFEQLNGKELFLIITWWMWMQLYKSFMNLASTTFGIIKHTNICGIAQRSSVKKAGMRNCRRSLSQHFGGVLVCNGTIDKATADASMKYFFEVLIARLTTMKMRCQL